MIVRKVCFDRFGGPEVLAVRDVREPVPGRGQIRVRVRAAGLNPVDHKLFAGGPVADRYRLVPSSGNGHDFSGIVDSLGEGVSGFSVGEAVFGGARFRAQADHVIVDDLTTLNRLPSELDHVKAGALDLAGRTAIASVRSLGLTPRDTVLIGAAAGGVGSLASQLAVRAGARVIGTASRANHDFLAGIGVEPLSYGRGLAERVRQAAPEGITGVLDYQGRSTIEAGLDLGVPTRRINTVADAAAAAEFGLTTYGRSSTEPWEIRPLADLVANGEIIVPIEAVYPLEEVADAYQ